MTLWGLCQLEDLTVPRQLWKHPAANRKFGSLGLSAILMRLELQSMVKEQADLLQRIAVRSSETLGLSPSVAGNIAAARLAADGDAASALASIKQMASQGHVDSLTLRIARACGADGSFLSCADLCEIPCVDGSNVVLSASESKAQRLLEYVLQRTVAGDPHAFLAATEEFASVLGASRQWLKIAGGDKAGVLERELRSAPRGCVLEVGTYLGYSAARMASIRPSCRVISIEVDLEHSLVAQCLLMHCGLWHRVQVLTGHSKDVLARLPDYFAADARAEESGRGAELTLAAIFMDQGASRFWEDLKTLEKHRGLLRPGALLIADNVLKPGAPIFLWQLFSPCMEKVVETAWVSPRVVPLEEFGMPGVEDWMAIAYYAGRVAEVHEVPSSRIVEDLEWEAHSMRLRAVGPGGVDFAEWAIFAKWMRHRLAELGISAPSV